MAPVQAKRGRSFKSLPRSWGRMGQGRALEETPQALAPGRFLRRLLFPISIGRYLLARCFSSELIT
jgi:hypothetical protein